MNSNEGFFLLEDVLNKDVLQKLLTKISNAYISESAQNRFGGSISGHLNCMPGSEARELIDNIKETKILDEISKFFSVNIKEYNLSIGANINLPGSHYQHMHTDSNYFDEFFILNIPLISTTESNGSISIIPMSHTKHYSYIKYKLKGLYNNRIRLNQEVGSCLVRSSNLWHRGTPNKTNEIRPMINLVFTKNKSSDDSDFLLSNIDNHPDLVGPIVFKNNWYSASKKGIIWEYITVKIPVIYSIKRIIMSIIRPLGTST